MTRIGNYPNDDEGTMIKIEVGKSYFNLTEEMVTIVVPIDPTKHPVLSSTYDEGYRFIGDNGLFYDEFGRTDADTSELDLIKLSEPVSDTATTNLNTHQEGISTMKKVGNYATESSTAAKVGNYPSNNNSSLVLALGKTFIDEKNKTVKLVREFKNNEPDYVQGFRFRGDNGTNYQADGSVIGSIGRARIVQMGAYPLMKEGGKFVDDSIGLDKDRSASNALTVSWDNKDEYNDIMDKCVNFQGVFAELDQASWGNAHMLLVTSKTSDAGSITLPVTRVVPKPKLAIGQYYRNGLGHVVLIARAIGTDSRFYQYDYRFQDHRGSYYTADGSVKSKVYKPLDLLTLVDETDLTFDEMTVIHDQQMKTQDQLRARDSSIFTKIGRRIGWLAEPTLMVAGHMIAQA